MKLSMREGEGVGGSLASFFKDKTASPNLGYMLSTAKKLVLQEVKDGDLMPVKVHDGDEDDDDHRRRRQALLNRFFAILRDQLVDLSSLSKQEVDIFIGKIGQRNEK